MQSIVVPPMWKLIEQGIIFSEKIPHFDPRARNSAVRDIASIIRLRRNRPECKTLTELPTILGCPATHALYIGRHHHKLERVLLPTTDYRTIEISDPMEEISDLFGAYVRERIGNLFLVPVFDHVSRNTQALQKDFQSSHVRRNT
jgi:hypothetical protein